jgi:RNA-directed DNA polymerase
MKIEKEHKEYIQSAFAEMASREDFLDLLNYTKPLIFGEKAVLFKLQQVTYYSNPKRSQKHYNALCGRNQ